MTVFSCQKTSHQQLEHQNAILARSALQTREGRAAKPLQNIEYVSEYTANVQSSLHDLRENQSRNTTAQTANTTPCHHRHKIAERRPRIPSSQIYLSKNKTKPQRFIPSRMKYRRSSL
jgi:hypothetical protein